MKIGDFNNDGVLDLAVANSNDNTISILLGVGDGTFTAANGSPISAGIGNFPFFLAVADFNKDGNADLAVVNGRDYTLTLLEGNGDGTFKPFAGSPILLPAGGGASPIVAADFNGDGWVDLAVGNFDANNVDIFLNNQGAFTTPSAQSPISVGPSPICHGRPGLQRRRHYRPGRCQLRPNPLQRQPGSTTTGRHGDAVDRER